MAKRKGRKGVERSEGCYAPISKASSLVLVGVAMMARKYKDRTSTISLLQLVRTTVHILEQHKMLKEANEIRRNIGVALRTVSGIIGMEKADAQ